MRRSLLVAAIGSWLIACTAGGTEVEGGSPAPAEGGGPVTASIQIPRSVTSVINPHVAIDGAGGVHLVWREQAAGGDVIRHASVGGDELGDAEVISDAFDVVFSETPILTDADGRVCAFFDAFVDETDPSTRGFYRRCLSDGEWSNPALVASAGITTTYEPAFDASGAAGAIATTPVSSITFDGLELSEDGDPVGSAQLAIDTSGAYHVVWYELGERFELNHRVSTDAGATWSPIEAIQGAEFFVPDPTLIAASDGSVHVFYTTSLPFHRVWTQEAGWGGIDTGPECSGAEWAFALSPDDTPVAVCAGIGGIQLTTNDDGTWSELETIDGSTGPPAGPVALAIGPDGTRHVLWVAATEPPSLRYAAVPTG